MMKCFVVVFALLLLLMAVPCLAGADEHKYDGAWTVTVSTTDYDCDSCGIELVDEVFYANITGTRVCVKDAGHQECFEGEYSEEDLLAFDNVIRGDGFTGTGTALLQFFDGNLSGELYEMVTFKTDSCRCQVHIKGPAVKN